MRVSLQEEKERCNNILDITYNIFTLFIYIIGFLSVGLIFRKLRNLYTGYRDQKSQGLNLEVV